MLARRRLVRRSSEMRALLQAQAARVFHSRVLVTKTPYSCPSLRFAMSRGKCGHGQVARGDAATPADVMAVTREMTERNINRYPRIYFVRGAKWQRVWRGLEGAWRESGQ